MKNTKISSKHSNICAFSRKKIIFYENMIQKTVTSINKYKSVDIYGASELSMCIKQLEDVYETIQQLKVSIEFDSIKNDEILSALQSISNSFFNIFKTYGTQDIEDLLYVSFGNDYMLSLEELVDPNIYDIIKNHVRPIGFTILPWKEKRNENKKLPRNRIVEDFAIVDTAKTLDCFDLARTSRNFLTKVYGIKIAFQNPLEKKTLIVKGLVDNLLLECFTHPFVEKQLKNLDDNTPNDPDFKTNDFKCFRNSLSLKELLVYNNDDLYNRFVGYMNQVNLIKQKPISQVVKEFINSKLYGQRKTLIQLLLKENNPEFQYLSYLLYDLLSNDSNNSVDTQEQTLIYDSLPWSIRKLFRTAMKTTINYTKSLTSIDNNKIPLEQQICLLKADDKVKEKAMVKLKEVKAKSEDSGSKARQYLEGLLKIPFGIYKTEPILKVMKECTSDFSKLIKSIHNVDTNTVIPLQKNYTSIELSKYMSILEESNLNDIQDEYINTLISSLTKCKRNELVSNIVKINNAIKVSKMKVHKLIHSGKRSKFMKDQITGFIQEHKNNALFVDNLCKILKYKEGPQLNIIRDSVKDITEKWGSVKNTMNVVRETLDKSVFGHDNAKRQIERIIGQWMNGELTGYCFGFEGPPGVGKCLAKDTPVMMSDGSIKLVQDITMKDKLMGDDSTERNILALGSGREKMYRIEQVKGDDYVVNESHILSLKMSKAGRKGDKHQTILGRRYYKGDVVDICIKDYLNLPKYLKDCLKGYKVGVDFHENEVSIEPYALGCWLGDGSKYKNVLINRLRDYNLINNKHIPQDYKCNSRDIRLQLLAGLLDTDGYYNKSNNSYDIIQKNKTLAEDILFLVRSLGFRGTMKQTQKSCMYKGEKRTGTYYRIIITGSGLEEIPILVSRKKGRANKQIKNALHTGINVVPLEEGEYFGFQIDGNARFLLGDFTVTHNTSLAKKGLAHCLRDMEGKTRPFGFIPIGGSSNGSILDGHNYTYVGSTWGRIVDVLMESKCMNPIIFIDELDKVSRTEHGKEIIGILTHMVDPTQNDDFQDKYFNGISIDLSKALIIFSYNDINAIDRILLDRIHRIKFEPLTLKEKITITKNYLLPEIYKKLGLNKEVVHFEDDVIEQIIETYTVESGVRKLKELLFEILSEINLEVLKDDTKNIDIPIIVSYDDIKDKYLKDYREVRVKEIHDEPQVGIMNGLWANSLGKGGIIPIQTQYYPTTTFLDLKLTGKQGDVMKESMNVAKTLAYRLTSTERQKELITMFKETNMQGIHIHCPEGAVPKDGPSAGTAITVSIVSLFNDKKIKNDIAITGEINLQGCVTAIGGLKLKILGGIKAGIKEFIYPDENQDDFDKFMEDYGDNELLDGITFHAVKHIDEVLPLVFVEE